MTDVSTKAAQLSHLYWEALFDNLLGWRGTGSLDAPSRVFAGIAIGRLIQKKDEKVIHNMISQICAALNSLKPREIEERHGLLMAFSRLIDQAIEQKRYDTIDYTYSWNLLEGVLNLEDKSFISPTQRPELTAVSICNLLGSLSDISCRTPTSLNPTSPPQDHIIRLFNLCLTRTEESVLLAIPKTAQALLQLLTKASPTSKYSLISTWLTTLETEQSYNQLRGSGYAIALGAAYPQLNDAAPTDSSTTQPSATPSQHRIITALANRCGTSVPIAARTVALRALSILLDTQKQSFPSKPLPSDIKQKVAEALNGAMNDYTVTERGDVGSLVRLEALSTIETGWSLGLIEAESSGEQLHADVLRLSLEKLDKIRTRAAHVLEVGSTEHFERYVKRLYQAQIFCWLRTSVTNVFFISGQSKTSQKAFHHTHTSSPPSRSSTPPLHLPSTQPSSSASSAPRVWLRNP